MHAGESNQSLLKKNKGFEDQRNTSNACPPCPPMAHKKGREDFVSNENSGPFFNSGGNIAFLFT